MKILSVSMRRPGCGVSDYADEIEAELRRLGHDVTATDHSEALKIVNGTRFDRVLMQFEIVESSREGEVFSLVRTIGSLARIGITPSVVSHTILSNDLVSKAPLPLRKPLLWYQTGLLRYLSKRSDLISLNPDGVATLGKMGVKARFVPVGVYGDRGASPQLSALAAYKKAGAFVCAIIGHPYRFKRYGLAVDAFAEFMNRASTNAVFAVVGGDKSVDPAAWEELSGALSRLPKERLVITSMLDDASFWSTLADVDVAMLPYEDLPTGSGVVARLTAAAVPMIVSTSRAFAGVVSAGGAIAVAQWPQEAALALERVASDSNVQETLKNGLQSIQQKESLTATVRSMVRINA